jgi:pimeloyl-ACP methyl ester carboxylesterase
VPAAFYQVPEARSGVLVLSGSADPVTPPRHGDRVARALGARAVHVVVPNAGHGVLALACVRDLSARFVDEPDETQALRAVRESAACVAKLPAPPVYLPPMGVATEESPR